MNELLNEIPDKIKCKKCSTITRIPDNIVIRYDPDGESVFSSNIREFETNFSPLITIYCSNCCKPIFETEFNEDDLITIDEETVLKIEVLEDLKDIVKK